jgi:6-bladed beta-propeller
VTLQRFGAGRHIYEVDPIWEAMSGSWEDPDANGITVDKDDTVHVLRTSTAAMVSLTTSGEPIAEWKIPIPPGSRLLHAPDFVEAPPPDMSAAAYPHSVVANANGELVVPDNHENTVRKYSATGTLLETLGSPGNPSDTGVDQSIGAVVPIGIAAGPFNGPADVTFAPSGDMYVADGYRNARIHCFSDAGELRFSFGSPGSGPGEFRLPHAVAVHPDGRLIVADRENNRLQFFDLTGHFLHSWTDLTRPSGIAIDTEGYIYVVELGSYATFWRFIARDSQSPPSRFTIFDPAGRVVARWGERDASLPGSFFVPHCIALDSDGCIYIGETNSIIEQGLGDGPPSGARGIHKFVPVKD